MKSFLKLILLLLVATGLNFCSVQDNSEATKLTLSGGLVHKNLLSR